MTRAQTHISSLRRGALLAITICALTPAGAQAATYDVTACKAAPGNVNNAFAASNTDPTHLRVGEVCSGSGPYDGVFAVDRGETATNPRAGSEARQTVRAPTGLTITRLRYYRYLGKQDDDGWIPALRDSTGAIVANETCSIGATPSGRCMVGADNFSSASYRDIGGLSTSELSVGIRCGPPATACIDGGANIRLAFAVIYSATVTISDTANPTTANEGGTLFSPGAKQGTHTASFDAADASGIRDARLYVDGALRSSSARTCDFTKPRPCEDATGASLSLDTRTLSNGAHTAQVAATDAAGNEGRGTARTFTVDNPPPPPPPASGGGSSGGNSSSGGGGGGGSSDGGSSGGSAPPPEAPTVVAPLVTLAPSPTVRASASARVRRGALGVRGRVIGASSGRVRVTVRYTAGRRKRTLVRTVRVARGTFRFSARVARSARAPRASARYLG